MHKELATGQTKVDERPEFWRDMYRGSTWLAWLGWIMVADAGIALVGLLADPAIVDGNPAWLKPLKFAISTCLFSFTVAFMMGQMERTRRFAQWMGRIMAAALTVEIILIDMQAARHTTSHFNLSTRLDAAVWMAMGSGIAVLSLSTVLLFAASCFERFRDRALGWAVRLSLLLALIGMSAGAMMSLPTPGQLAAAHAGQGMPRSGAHTVGAPDGGAGMPLTGWSADHGDVRIAHFLGLHAMQALVLAWWVTRRQWSEAKQTRLMWTVAASFLTVFGLTLWQALRGQAFQRPDAATWIGWACWLSVTAAGLLWVGLSIRGLKNGSRFAEMGDAR